MIIAQTIVDQIISNIKAKLGNGIEGAGIGIRDTKNRVVTLYVSDSGDRINIGIDDREGSYFYIRENGVLSETRLQSRAQKFSSCFEIQARYPMRLVAQHRCQDARTFLEAIKSALYSQKISSLLNPYDVRDVKFFPQNVNPIPWSVYATETGRDANQMQSNMQIVSIDFILQFTYTYSETCVNYEIC